MKNLIFTIAFAAVLLGCKKHEEVSTVEETKFKALSMEYAAADTTAVEADMQAPAAASFKNYSNDKEESPEVITPKIIKNARLRFQTSNVDTTTTAVQQLVKKYKGNIQRDLQEHEDYRLSHSMSVRVPSANFDVFIADLSKGVDYYDNKEISSEDVTEEYVDIMARVKTKKQLENRYYELLKKANKVSEMLEIEQKLSEIREEIEAKEGRLKYLQTKVSMSTIDLYFYKEIAQGTSKRQSYGSKIIASLGTGFNSISYFLLAILDNWPLILIFVIAFVFIRRKLKKRKQHV